MPISYRKAKDMSFEERLKNTIYFIEANSFEQLKLWEEWSDDPAAISFGSKNDHRMKWEQISDGRLETIGKYAGAPVVIHLFWVVLNNKLICFYEATSLIVDYDMVDKWITKHAPNGRRSRCDAMNFSHCIAAIQEKKDE